MFSGSAFLLNAVTAQSDDWKAATLEDVKTRLPADPLCLRINSGTQGFTGDYPAGPAVGITAWKNAISTLINTCDGAGINSVVINSRPNAPPWDFRYRMLGLPDIRDYMDGTTPPFKSYSGTNFLFNMGLWGQLYDRYRILSLTFEYVPGASKMTDGQVMLLWNDNPTDTIPGRSSGFMMHTKCVVTQVYNRAKLTVYPRKWLFTDPGRQGGVQLAYPTVRGQVLPGVDRDIDAGWFSVCGRCPGLPPETVIGSIRVHFVVQYSRPSVNVPLTYSADGTVQAGFARLVPQLNYGQVDNGLQPAPDYSGAGGGGTAPPGPGTGYSGGGAGSKTTRNGRVKDKIGTDVDVQTEDVPGDDGYWYLAPRGPVSDGEVATTPCTQSNVGACWLDWGGKQVACYEGRQGKNLPRGTDSGQSSAVVTKNGFIALGLKGAQQTQVWGAASTPGAVYKLRTHTREWYQSPGSQLSASSCAIVRQKDCVNAAAANGFSGSATMYTSKIASSERTPQWYGVRYAHYSQAVQGGSAPSETTCFDPTYTGVRMYTWMYADMSSSSNLRATLEDHPVPFVRYYAPPAAQVRGQARFWGLIAAIIRVVVGVVKAVVAGVKKIIGMVHASKQQKTISVTSGTTWQVYPPLGAMFSLPGAFTTGGEENSPLISPYDPYTCPPSLTAVYGASGRHILGEKSVFFAPNDATRSGGKVKMYTTEIKGDVDPDLLSDSNASPGTLALTTLESLEASPNGGAVDTYVGPTGNSAVFMDGETSYAVYDKTAMALAGDPPLDVMLELFSGALYQGGTMPGPLQ